MHACVMCIHSKPQQQKFQMHHEISNGHSDTKKKFPIRNVKKKTFSFNKSYVKRKMQSGKCKYFARFNRDKIHCE